MNLKEKMKSPRFWSVAAGLITMVLLAVGIRVPAPAVNEILGSISAFLVLIGFIKPESAGEKSEKKEENSEYSASQKTDDDKPE